MRVVLALTLVLGACSNANNPDVDAAVRPIDADADTGSAPAARILVINEVAPGETPDWFEVVNVTSSAVDLSQFVFCDVANDFVKAKPFGAVVLGPGEYHAQDVDDTVAGFKLASDEELWIYRAADQALSDSVDWAEGAGPAGSSYARSPDTTGDFATSATPSKGTANP